MVRLASLVLLITLAIAIGVGCSSILSEPTSLSVPSTINVKTRYREIKELTNLGRNFIEEGRFLEATDIFSLILQLELLSEQSAQIYLELAQAEKGAMHFYEALVSLKKILTIGAKPSVELEARVLAAQIEYELKQYSEVIAHTSSLLANSPCSLISTQRRDLFLVLANSFAALNYHRQAALNFLFLLQEASLEEIPSLAVHLYSEACKVSLQEIDYLLSQAIIFIAKNTLILAKSEIQLREGHLEAAQSNLNLIANVQELPPGLRERLIILTQEAIQAANLNLRAVGIILPFSGNYAAQARQILAAVELGLGLFNEGISPPILYIEDDHSEPTQAAEAVRRLVEERKVIAIIGPLLANSAISAAQQAQSFGVPIITLTQADDVTKVGDYVFQNFFNPTEQITALLNEVIGKRGCQQLAILAPHTIYGQGFQKLFKAEALARNSQLVQIINYDPAQTDFSSIIQEMSLSSLDFYRGSIKPQLKFQALFIPDNPERVALLVPQLALFNSSQVLLLGTSIWHSPKLLEVVGHSIENILFPDAFDPSSVIPLVSRFISDYRRALGHDPTVVEAHGYDAALLVREVLNSSEPPRSRRFFRDALVSLRKIIGVCGELTITPDRRVSKPLTLFTIQGGAFHSLSAVEGYTNESELFLKIQKN